jgi:hypothetical protein
MKDKVDTRRKNAFFPHQRQRNGRSSLRLTLGTCGVAFGAFSLFLMLVAFAVLEDDDLWWNVDSPIQGLPAPGDYFAWVRPGSPMNCLLTSRQARLSVDFGERAWFSTDSTVNITVGETTTITGDGLEDLLLPYGQPSFLRRAGLPRALGLLHFLDFIGASQRPEADLQCPNLSTWNMPTWHVATLSFECEGIPQQPIFFEADCPKLWNGILRQPVYFRAYGITDVARSVVVNNLRMKNGSLPPPATVGTR